MNGTYTGAMRAAIFCIALLPALALAETNTPSFRARTFKLSRQRLEASTFPPSFFSPAMNA